MKKDMALLDVIKLDKCSNIGENYDNSLLEEYCNELKYRVLDRNILFVNCPQFNIYSYNSDVVKNKAYYVYPNTGLQCLKSSLNGRNLNIEIFDLNYNLLRKLNDDEINIENWLEIFKEKFDNGRYSVIGLSSLFEVDFPYYKKIANYLKTKESIVISGGQNATYNTKELLNEGCCHFVLQREAENKIKFLFDYIYENCGNKPTPQIFFKHKNKIHESQGDLDIVKFEGDLIDSYENIPLEDYCNVGSLSPYSRIVGKDKKFGAISFNRGCRANCRFCDVGNFSGRKVRTRNIEDTLKEIDFLYNNKGVRFLELLDDDLLYNRENVKKLFKGIIYRNYKDLKWASTNGIIAAFIDEEAMNLFRDSGCVGFRIGLESGNSEILRNVKKPGTKDTFRRFGNLAQKYPEMFIVDNIIVGVPNETLGQMMDSFNFSLELNLDCSSFAEYQKNVSWDDKILVEHHVPDFQPPKDGIIFEGLKIFDIPNENIPTREQLHDIWFGFTLLRNYLYNKNLLGNTHKFIGWFDAVKDRYPSDPSIDFYLGIANCLIDNNESALIHKNLMLKNLNNDKERRLWKSRFVSYKMDEIVNDFPNNSLQAKEAIEFLRKQTNLKIV